MKRLLNRLRRWLRRVLGIQSPSKYFNPSSWPALPEPKARPFVGVDLANHPDMTSGLPLVPVPPKQPARPALPPAIFPPKTSALDAVHAIINEIHEATRPDEVLYADNRPEITIRVDGLDALRYTLCQVADAANRFAKAMRELVTQAVTDAAIIAQYATPKETHYILHGRKARTRKKYRNRVLRRARRIKVKEGRP